MNKKTFLIRTRRLTTELLLGAIGNPLFYQPAAEGTRMRRVPPVSAQETSNEATVAYTVTGTDRSADWCVDMQWCGKSILELESF